jgi:hypothetical protein
MPLLEFPQNLGQSHIFRTNPPIDHARVDTILTRNGHHDLFPSV